ncbi:MAG: hypothetical protein AAF234_16150 [Pseudomonadota bacterium]
MTDAVTVTDEMVTVAADIISSSKLGEPFEDTARLALNAALSTQPSQREQHPTVTTGDTSNPFVEMSDPKADEATHAYIGDDVDAMRWGQIGDELAKNQEYRERIAELKSAYAELHGDWENAINRCRQASEDRDQALAREKQLREALTPSADTKAAYMGEFRMGVRLRDPNSGEEDHRSVDVPWTTIKEIMAAIRDYAEQKA